MFDISSGKATRSGRSLSATSKAKTAILRPGCPGCPRCVPARMSGCWKERSGAWNSHPSQRGGAISTARSSVTLRHCTKRSSGLSASESVTSGSLSTPALPRGLDFRKSAFPSNVPGAEPEGDAEAEAVGPQSSYTTTSKPRAISGWKFPGASSSNCTAGSDAKSFSRNQFPAVTSSTRRSRAAGRSVRAVLSSGRASSPSSSLSRALRRPALALAAGNAGKTSLRRSPGARENGLTSSSAPSHAISTVPRAGFSPKLARERSKSAVWGLASWARAAKRVIATLSRGEPTATTSSTGGVGSFSSAGAGAGVGGGRSVSRRMRCAPGRVASSSRASAREGARSPGASVGITPRKRSRKSAASSLNAETTRVSGPAVRTATLLPSRAPAARRRASSSARAKRLPPPGSSACIRARTSSTMTVDSPEAAIRLSSGRTSAKTSNSRMSSASSSESHWRSRPRKARWRCSPMASRQKRSVGTATSRRRTRRR